MRQDHSSYYLDLVFRLRRIPFRAGVGYYGGGGISLIILIVLILLLLRVF
ncbi:MAG: DUF3309 family protein [Acidobacteriaceae bacterium]